MEYLDGRGKYADRETYPFPSILLLDLHMPEGDGFAVLSRVDEIKNINRAYALGANSFLTKPSHEQDLQALIRSFHDYWIVRNKRPARMTSEDRGS